MTRRRGWSPEVLAMRLYEGAFVRRVQFTVPDVDHAR